MSGEEAARPYRRQLEELVKRGLLREVYRRGELPQGQFARLMEERRGR